MELKKHNKIAYENVQKMFKQGKNKVAVVHPTGTGKTYIADKMIEDRVGKRGVIIAPTNALLNQHIERLKENNIDYKNVEFLTYSKVMKMNEEQINELMLEYIILDEFHHCGAREWGDGIKKLLEKYNQAHTLGLSATPIRYLDKLRDMGAEIFEGNIASEISLAEAILDGLLEVPVYHQGIYSIKEEKEKIKSLIESIGDIKIQEELEKDFQKVNEITSNIEGIREILEKGITEDKKSGRYIVFCRDIKDMHKAMKNVTKWFENINEVEIYSMASQDINGKTIERKQNEKEIKLFEDSNSDKIKLMFAVNMLNEGIHIKDIDGIIMLRGTKSPILYRQQIGRVLSIGGKKKPLIFDFADNIECTKYVYNLYQEMTKIVKNRKKSGINTKKADKVLKDFQISDYIKTVRKLIEELDDNTYYKLWIKNFDILKDYIKSSEEIRKYFEEKGKIKQSTIVEKDGKKIRIGSWLDNQRTFMRKYQNMTIDQIKEDKNISKNDKEKMVRLLELGVSYREILDIDNIWEKKFNLLVKYINSSEEIKDYFMRTSQIRKQKE